jgi:hypothetical protein
LRIVATCPDCDNAPLHEICAIRNEDQNKSQIDPGDLLNAPGNDESWGWCPNCERTWNIKVSYDEVFAGKHEGDPK